MVELPTAISGIQGLLTKDGEISGVPVLGLHGGEGGGGRVEPTSGFNFSTNSDYG